MSKRSDGNGGATLQERPRERILRHGAASLADSELVALLLRTGAVGCPVVEAARRLLERRGGLPGLAQSTPRTLRGVGLGGAKIASILAAIEIGRRLTRAEVPQRRPLREPATVARYLAMTYCRAGQEVMGALFLDTRHRLIDEDELFRGTLDRAAVEPRQILKRGLLCDAAYLILFHTHPSGDAAPSAEDLCFTRRIAEAGEIVGVRLLDHVIVAGPQTWLSLKEYGAW